MRAACLPAPAPIETAPLVIGDRPTPAPGPGEVRIRVQACGVCHTDLHIAEGDLPPHRSPVIPGHQIVGLVDALGTGVDAALAGARVGVTWLAWADGDCPACRRGDENLCERVQFTGYDVDGGFAEFALARAAFVVPVPVRFGPDEAAPLLCGGAIGYRALQVAGVQPGEWLGLFGFGASAHLALQVARHRGCQVAVVTRGAAHRALAEDLGAHWVGEPGATPPRPLDRAIVFAPSGQVVQDALRAVRPGGTVAINAIAMDALPAMPYATIYGERVLRSVTNLTRADAREFLATAAEIPVRVEVEMFPLEGANDALQRLKARTLRAAAVLHLT
ncbi:MAG: zinc-dependent alcohol dehydrogenase family protein [Armatimonadetes bacterium]|nr:zinc-dependent alcohol dehydrogenase family protein [Armatimonadota bacterium]